MGQFAGKLDVLCRPRKVWSYGAKGNQLACILTFPKKSRYNTSNLQGDWEKNKQTNRSEASLCPHPLSCYFLKQGKGQRGKRAILVIASQ